jgi:hypothetical protein
VVRELDRAGKARQFGREGIDRKSRELQESGHCRSKVTHVLALAIASHTRLLCSCETNLHVDFKNERLLQPKGAVYQN